MISEHTVREIIAVYAKHGWVLRRVLLSAGPKKAILPDGEQTFDGVPVSDSDIDAAWFSRPYKPGGVAWEIRYLGPTQYALVENIDEDGPDFENSLRDVEARLREAMAGKN